MNVRTTQSPEQSSEDKGPSIGAYRARHLALRQRQISTKQGDVTVVVNESESPLIWLARRRGRNGCPLVDSHQLQAGERLRQDFTYASLMPSVTANWSNPTASARRRAGHQEITPTDAMVAARQRVHLALNAVGPEFAGLLVDVCCFLKGLEDVERERAWLSRAGKVVLRLALERLARHYGYAKQTRGPTRTPVLTWLADGVQFSVDSI